jgi:site-specific recombinase XerD
MKKLLTSTPAEEMLRDRAVLEVLYSAGLRIGELMRLELRDVDLTGGVIFVRQGKGKKDRVVPTGQIACTLMSRYIREVRVPRVRRVAFSSSRTKAGG